MKLLYLLFIFSAGMFTTQAKDYKLSSPDQRKEVIIQTNNKILFSVLYNNQIVIKPSLISMQLESKEQVSAKVIKTNTRIVNEVIPPTVATKNAIIPWKCLVMG